MRHTDRPWYTARAKLCLEGQWLGTTHSHQPTGEKVSAYEELLQWMKRTFPESGDEFEVLPWRPASDEERLDKKESYVGCTLEECVAFSIYSPSYEGTAGVDVDFLNDGAVPNRDQSKVYEWARFTEEDARWVGRFVADRFGFCGHVTRSRSGKTWNVWNEMPEGPSVPPPSNVRLG